MSKLPRSAFLGLGINLAAAVPASAVRVPGSPAKAGCYAVFDVEGGSASEKKVICSDCDASCDIGGPAGQADGQCVFMVRYCLNDTTAAPACKAAGIQKVRAPLLLPGSLTFPAPSTDTDCSAATPITVKLKKKGKKPGKRVVTLLAQAVKGTKPKTERGQLVLVCTPHTTGACPTTTTSTTTTSTTSTTTTTTCLPPTGGGGGVACANNPAGGPRELDMVDSASGGDLDNGTTGISHNFPIPQGATLKYCLSDCDGASQPVCQASGPTGKGSLNGETFGPPLPLFSSNVPVCVVNRFADPVNKAVVNVQTGIFDATTTPVHLKSDVYLTNQPPEDVCPICTGSGVGATGTCDSGPNRGKSCTVEGIVIVNNPPSVVNKKYTLSSSCPPDPAQFKATLDITLPLTNDPAKPSTLAANAAGSFPCPGQTQHDECGGTACNVDCSATPPVQGGVNQLCCASDGTTPCFPTSPASGSKPIVRTGAASPPTPSWVPNQTPSATAANNVLAATFCEAATGSSIIDTTAGLAGPGALLLSGTATFVGNTATNTPPTCSTPTTSTTTATTTTTTTTSTTTTTVFSCAPSTPVACMGGSTAFTKVMFAQGQGTTFCGGAGVYTHCTSGEPGTDGRGGCTSDSDCTLACINGQCADGTPCTSNADCASLPTGTCGGGPAPMAPFSGCFGIGQNVGSPDTGCTGPDALSGLGLSCLYIGGGNAITTPPSLNPDGSKLELDAVCCANDPATTHLVATGTNPTTCTKGAGPGTHCTNPPNAANIRACSSDGDCLYSCVNGHCADNSVCTTDQDCNRCVNSHCSYNPSQTCQNNMDCPGPPAPAAACALDANCFFGPPLPIASGALSVCVVNVIQQDAFGQLTTSDGNATITYPLSSRVYLTGNSTEPCPKCVNNVCDSGRNQGMACTPVGSEQTTLDCPPTLSTWVGPIPVSLSNVTTGQSIATADANGVFCASDGQIQSGAFGNVFARYILEKGSPAGPLTDTAPHASTLASTFCIPASGSPAVDGAGGLPGPGATSLPGMIQLVP